MIQNYLQQTHMWRHRIGKSNRGRGKDTEASNIFWGVNIDFRRTEQYFRPFEVILISSANTFDIIEALMPEVGVIEVGVMTTFCY